MYKYRSNFSYIVKIILTYVPDDHLICQKKRKRKVFFYTTEIIDTSTMLGNNT